MSERAVISFFGHFLGRLSETLTQHYRVLIRAFLLIADINKLETAKQFIDCFQIACILVLQPSVVYWCLSFAERSASKRAQSLTCTW